MQSNIHRKAYKVRSVLHVSQAKYHPNNNNHKFLKAAQMFFRLLPASDSPINNSNCPEPSIHSKVFLFISQMACRTSEILADPYRQRLFSITVSVRKHNIRFNPAALRISVRYKSITYKPLTSLKNTQMYETPLKYPKHHPSKHL